MRSRFPILLLTTKFLYTGDNWGLGRVFKLVYPSKTRSLFWCIDESRRQRLHRPSPTQIFTSSRYPSDNSKTTLMNRDAVRLIVRFIVNVTLLNALSTDSSNQRHIATRYEKLAANYTAMLVRLYFVVVIV
jgi:hypothetical protein